MVVLGADTSTGILAAALSRDGRPLASAMYAIPRGHSRLLQPALASLLEVADLRPCDLEALAVGVGPGSYTGVRIGVSTVKAMALVLSVPVYPVSTLLSMAQVALPGALYASSSSDAGVKPEDAALLMPLLYARRGRAFGAIFHKVGDGHLKPLVPEQVQEIQVWRESFAQLLAQSRSSVAHSAIIHDFEQKEELRKMVPPMSGVLISHLSEVGALLGAAMLQLVHSGQIRPVSGSDIHHLTPNYALQVEAEARLAERGGG